MHYIDRFITFKKGHGLNCLTLYRSENNKLHLKHYLHQKHANISQSTDSAYFYQH